MIATLSWWIVIQVFGLAALPLAWRLCGRLPSRGYPLAKALGLLLVSYLLWLGATFRLLPNDTGGILIALLAVVGLSAWLGRSGLRRAGDGPADRPIVTWLRENWRLILATELLLAAVLAAWAVFRAYSGDIAGTEKPMEFAFINGVLNSHFFPPQDPWLAGYAISYYYFGYVMLGVLIRLSGVQPAVGFNLGVAMWYALTLVGAFGIGYDLVRLGGERAAHASGQGRGIRFGLVGALFVGIVGNLEGLVEIAYNLNLVPLSWIQWIDVNNLTGSPPSGSLGGGFWWWWRASRVVHDQLMGKTFEVIDEFPFFSFLLGDLHPHVLGLPFVLLAIGLALNLLFMARERALATAGTGTADPGPADRPEETVAERLGEQAVRFWHFLGDTTGLGTPGVLLYAIVLGGLSFLNTWDFPIYLALATLALAAGLAIRNGMSWALVGRAAAGGVVLGILGVVLYLPFYIGFQSQAGGILPNLLFPTRLSQFFLMFGPFLVALVCLLWLMSRDVPRAALRRGFFGVLPWTLFVPVLFLGALIAAGLLLPQGREIVEKLLQNGDVQSAIGQRTAGQVVGLIAQVRLATPWTYLLLAGLIAWIGGLLWANLAGGETTEAAGQPGTALERGSATTAQPLACREADLFVLLLAGLALLLTFAVEFVYLRDFFSSRMNTVFKFYYQAWILLALAATYAVGRLADRETPARLALPGLALVGVLVLGGLYYPLAATPSKADDFRGQPTLDGLAYMRGSDPADLAAIAWIRANVPPAAVVLEASGSSYSTDGAERISMSTGNPTLMGWDFHEMQWRGKAYSEVTAGRPQALDQIYRTARAEDLRSLLDTWHIDYVYIGALEKRTFGINDASLARFDRELRLVYDQDGVRIYAK